MNAATFSALSLLLSSGILFAQADKRPIEARPPEPPAPPRVYPAPSEPPKAQQVFVYDQKPLQSRPYLVSPEQAQTIINQFKEGYSKLGSPRLLIYVNRELVDEESGMKLSARREQTEAARGANAATTNSTVNTSTEKVNGNNTYKFRDKKQSALADRQTVRDVERLFGRPLRMAGASLADQRIATQLMADQPLQSFTVQTEGEQTRKDREVLAKIADVVLEILISSRSVTVPGISGDGTITVPDIQATAIRLLDSKIIGQASSSDLMGNDPNSARSFDVREITEATALALMEDMLR